MHECTLTLTVSNHPGVLSRIAGLFARRNYNLDGVYVVGLTGTTESHMQLLLKRDDRLPQIINQLEKLYDVQEISVNEGRDMPSCFQVAEAG